jgi:hypothetical protein
MAGEDKLFRDLRESYRKAHEQWVKNDKNESVKMLKDSIRIAVDLIVTLRGIKEVNHV